MNIAIPPYLRLFKSSAARKQLDWLLILFRNQQQLAAYIMANVFISHRGADTVLAERLAGEIQAAGHTVWLDAWEITIGDQIVERMNEGLKGSTYLVLCYSALGMAPWINIEWASALARQLNGEGVKILPARLSGTEAPAILAGTKYADLIMNWSQGVADLLKAMK